MPSGAGLPLTFAPSLTPYFFPRFLKHFLERLGRLGTLFENQQMRYYLTFLPAFSRMETKIIDYGVRQILVKILVLSLPKLYDQFPHL